MTQVAHEPPPRIHVAPKHEFSQWEAAVSLSNAVGFYPDYHQNLMLKDCLGRNKNGGFTSKVFMATEPRQNGKNGFIEVRELYGILVLGERILHTAHEHKTAMEAFSRLSAYFDGPDAPFGDIAVVRRSNAHCAIYIVVGADGERIPEKDAPGVRFVARSPRAGRGFTADVLVLDECQELKPEFLQAILPALSVGRTHESQTIYTGTAPSDEMNGETFLSVRDNIISGTLKNASLIEWSMPHDNYDVNNRDHWYMVNPALGTRMNVENVEQELGQLSETGFARERLNVFFPILTGNRCFSEAEWSELKTDSPGDGDVWYGVDMPPDRSQYIVSACIKTGWNSFHIEIAGVFDGDNPDSVLSWIDGLVEKGEVWIDSVSPAAELIHEAKSRQQYRRIRFKTTDTRQYGQACGWMYTAIKTGKLTHFNQPDLNQAVLGATKREIGLAGVFGWNRKDITVNISPFVAATVALFGAKSRRARRSGDGLPKASIG